MNPKVEALSKALDELRDKLIQTPRTSPGFGEMRLLYLELTGALIAVGDKTDTELAKKIEAISKDIVEEWSSNKDKIHPWLSVIRPVVDAVSSILNAKKLSNPLLALLS